MIEVNLATLFVVGLIAGVGAYFGSYLREKGKNLATHEDTEDIKAEITGGLWERQTRWAFKRDLYVAILEGLQEAWVAYRRMETLLKQALPTDDSDALIKRLNDEMKDEFAAARSKLQKAVAVARIFLTADAITAINAYEREDASAADTPGLFEMMKARRQALERAGAVIVEIARKDLHLFLVDNASGSDTGGSR